MATIIDALVVTLGLDPKGFAKGMKDAEKGLDGVKKKSKNTSDEIKDHNEETANGFKKVTEGVGKFLAMLGGAYEIKHFIEDITDSNAALNRLSQNLGESTQSISTWAGAVEELGGSGKSAEGTMSMLSKSMTELLVTGDTHALPYFRALGVNLQSAAASGEPLSDILNQLHAGLTTLSNTKGRATANNFGLMMGVDQDTLNLLLATDTEYQRFLGLAAKYNAVTQEQAKHSQEFQTKLAVFHMELLKIGRDLVELVTPALEWLGDAFEYVGSHRGLVMGFFAAIGVAAIAALIPVTELLAELALMAAPFIIAGIVIGLFWDDWDTWMRGGKSSFGDFYQFVSDTWKTLMDDLSMEHLKKMWTDFKAWLHGDTPDSQKRAAIEGIGQQSDAEKRAKAYAASRASGSSVSEADALKYFQSQGWTPAQAAGIVANLKRESGLSGSAVGDNGQAYGIAQFHPDRQANFKRFAGKDIRNASAMEQLAFVNYELTKGTEQNAGARLRGATNAGDAGSIVSSLYERPKNATLEAAQRASMAMQIAGGRAPVATAGGGTTSVQTNIGAITVNTKATDGPGIARDLFASIKDQSLVAQAETGGF